MIYFIQKYSIFVPKMESLILSDNIIFEAKMRIFGPKTYFFGSKIYLREISTFIFMYFKISCISITNLYSFEKDD